MKCISPGQNDVEFFKFNSGSPVEPVCALSLKAAGALRPVENEDRRQDFFSSVIPVPYGNVVSLSQIHSRTVFKVSPVCSGTGNGSGWVFSAFSSWDGDIADARKDSSGRHSGDGILSTCASVVPCVTVADCMPVWLFDPDTGCFGVLHSGWRGTGIIASALALAEKEWGSKASSFHVILGPHIRQCCYTVDEERAVYFSDNFSNDCVFLDEKLHSAGSKWPYRLSLAEANISLCLSLGIQPDRIRDTGICTSCSSRYGSSRREIMERGGMDSFRSGDSSVTPFTSMAAFIYWPV